MKQRKEKNVLVILIIIVFTGFIYWNYSKDLVNSKQEIIEKAQKTLEDDSSMVIYNQNTKLCKTRPTYAKEVFLTFDDGPSINITLNIIDILKRNGVKATFFVVGERAQSHPKIIRKMNASGMCIATHTYTHDYNEIYKSTEAYLKDMEKCNNIIKKLTNKRNFSYLRMPGGSDNLVSNTETLKKIKIALNKRNICYADWNVSSGDAVGHNIAASDIKQNVISQSKGKNMVVVLMHDSYDKKTTVDSLQEVISYFKKQGYVFRTFNDLTKKEKQKMITKEILNK